jgi:ferredoxin-NADP reductase
MVALGVKPDEWLPHLAGQHYEIRFPGERLSRKFSIASSPGQTDVIEFGLQVRPRGMLTPRLAACAPGTRLEIRGPTGQAFGWEPRMRGPLLLLGAGAGITPLYSIYHSYREADTPDPLGFVLSVRNRDRIYRRDQLPADAVVRITSRDGRIDRRFLEESIGHLSNMDQVRVRICGPSGFRGSMVDHLLALKVAPEHIRSEAFT